MIPLHVPHRQPQRQTHCEEESEIRRLPRFGIAAPEPDGRQRHQRHVEVFAVAPVHRHDRRQTRQRQTIPIAEPHRGCRNERGADCRQQRHRGSATHEGRECHEDSVMRFVIVSDGLVCGSNKKT